MVYRNNLLDANENSSKFFLCFFSSYAVSCRLLNVVVKECRHILAFYYSGPRRAEHTVLCGPLLMNTHIKRYKDGSYFYCSSKGRDHIEKSYFTPITK
jgi:hypothetical protein